MGIKLLIFVQLVVLSHDSSLPLVVSSNCSASEARVMLPMMIWWAILYSLSMLTRYRPERGPNS